MNVSEVQELVEAAYRRGYHDGWYKGVDDSFDTEFPMGMWQFWEMELLRWLNEANGEKVPPPDYYEWRKSPEQTIFPGYNPEDGTNESHA